MACTRDYARRYDRPNALAASDIGLSATRRGFDVLIAISSAPQWSELIPHGGGAVAILIASIVIALIAGTVALELHRNMFSWMVTTFVVTFVIISAVNHAVT